MGAAKYVRRFRKNAMIQKQKDKHEEM